MKKLVKIFLIILGSLLIFCFIVFIAIYLTLLSENKNSFEENYEGIVTNKFVDYDNRSALTIEVNNSLYSLDESAYNNIQVGDSVRKLKNDTAFIILIYKMSNDSLWNKTIIIDKLKIFK